MRTLIKEVRFLSVSVYGNDRKAIGVTECGSLVRISGLMSENVTMELIHDPDTAIEERVLAEKKAKEREEAIEAARLLAEEELAKANATPAPDAAIAGAEGAEDSEGPEETSAALVSAPVKAAAKKKAASKKASAKAG